MQKLNYMTHLKTKSLQDLLDDIVLQFKHAFSFHR